jgi:hypothetical protein
MNKKKEERQYFKEIDHSERVFNSDSKFACVIISKEPPKEPLRYASIDEVLKGEDK